MMKRADNDSFMDRGAVHRLSIAVDGYHRLAEVFFGRGSAEAAHIRRVLRAEYGPYALLYVKMQAVDSGTGELARLSVLARKLYGDPGIINRLQLLVFQLVPLAAFRGFRNALRLARVLIRRQTAEPT
jgi:abequosyltransferase